jgi:predicted nuclease with TOPRIM domain
MDIALRRLLRRLNDQLLEHLRAHCAEQAARIEELEAENAKLNEAVNWFQSTTEMWQDIAMRMEEADEPSRLGLTKAGQVIVMNGVPS